MQQEGIKVEFEAFDLGMINYAKYLIRKGLVTPPYYFNFILGNIACAQADLLSLGLMIKELPENSIWVAGGVGNPQLMVNVMALTANGGVRAGLEDNIWYDQNRTQLASNRQIIKRVIHIAKELGKTPYPSKHLRSIFKL